MIIETMYNGSLVTGSYEWSEGVSYYSSLSIVAVGRIATCNSGVGCRYRCVWLPYGTPYNGDFTGGTTIDARRLSNLNGSPY